MIVTGTQRHRALQSQAIAFDGLKIDQLVLFGTETGEPNRKFGSYTLRVPFRTRVTETSLLSIPVSPIYCVSQRDMDALTLGGDKGRELLEIQSFQARVIVSGETFVSLRFVPAQDIDKTTIIQNIQDAAFEGDVFSPHPLTHSLTHSLTEKRSFLFGRRLLLGKRLLSESKKPSSQ